MPTSDNILITGASGLLGSALTITLLEKGYQVSHLGRSKKKDSSIKSYRWDITRGEIEEGAVENADYIIHLAGAGVADKRWTKEHKKAILNSRILSSRLLYEKIKEVKPKLKVLVSASAIGYYGMDTGDLYLSEDAPAGTDFLARVCQLWETEVDRIKDLGPRVVKLRIAMVLSDKGGALEKLMKPARLGLSAALGSGEQYMAWVHIDDLCAMFLKAIEDEKMKGPYNAASPEPVTNRQFTKCLAETLHRPMFLPAAPAGLLKLLLGEMSEMLLGGNRPSCQRIVDSGFYFQYGRLKGALEDLCNK